jgi:hypothetical protein
MPFYTAPVTLTTVLTLTTDPDGNGISSIRQPTDLIQAVTQNEHHGQSLGSRHSRPSSDRTTKYWIAAQEDLYQTSEFVKFFLPFGIGSLLVAAWHFMATIGCVLGALALAPVSWIEERKVEQPDERKVSEAVEKTIDTALGVVRKEVLGKTR